MALEAKYTNGVLKLVDFRDGGGFIIRCDCEGNCSVFSVPQYGGEEEFMEQFDNVCTAIEYAKTLT